MARARPSGTVTFLFTDIEGSTRLWEEHPEEMRDAVHRHDLLVRGAVEGHGGYVFTTAGDSFAAAFTSADDAAKSASEIQQLCADELWSHQVVLRVRCGLHTGVADERDGDYFGQAPNRAARIMAAANAGQILCSDVTSRLLGEGHGLIELGRFRLRDLGEPVELWQLASAAGDSFPALRTLDQSAGNLPVQLTELLGRDELVGSLGEAVQDCRLVTLTGVGGVGKTRLALHVAAEVGQSFGNGAWLVELAPVRRPDGVAEAVLDDLRIAPRPGMTSLESAVDRLRSMDALVVLDNCEHVISPVRGLVEELLGSCPRVTVLATSREGLGVTGEHIYPVPSLEVPTEDSVVSAAPAARLFVERATASGGWEPADADWPWIGELCRRLDGIPLAIELAAGRANVLSVEEIVKRLDDRFRLLTGQRGASLRRHETLRAAVEWSYELLGDTERELFDRLGVFVGAFDLDAATAVAGDETTDTIEMIDRLSALIDQSLVQVDRSGRAQRYRLLETLRQFAMDRLVETGTAEHARQRHALHFASEAERLADALRGPDEFTAREELDADLADLRAGVSWAIDVEHGQLVAALIGPFHIGPGFNQRSITSLASADALRVGGDDPTWGPALFTLAAWDTYLIGDPELAQNGLELAASAAKAADPRLATGARFIECMLAALAGDAPAAATTGARAFEMATALGDDYLRVFSSMLLNAMPALLGIDPPPIELAETAVRDAEHLGNPYLLANAHWTLGLRLELTDPDRALEIARAPGDDVTAAARQSLIGRVLLRRGQYEAALGHFQAHLQATYEAGLRVEFAYSARPAAGCLAKLGFRDRAAVIFASFPESPWANFADAEDVANTLLDEELDKSERAACVQEASQLDWTAAADLTMSALADALAHRDTPAATPP